MPRDPVTARREGEGALEERAGVRVFLMEVAENPRDVRPCSGPGPLHGRTSPVFSAISIKNAGTSARAAAARADVPAQAIKCQIIYLLVVSLSEYKQLLVLQDKLCQLLINRNIFNTNHV